MKNYYEILEVNPKASKEVIEKAYKVLAKKYHPDLYTGEKKQYAERKIKEINAAYNILSDAFLREQYDYELKREEMRYEENLHLKQNAIEQNMARNNYSQAIPKDTGKQERVKRQKIGTLSSMIDLTKTLVYDLARNKEKRKELKEVTKNDVLAIVLTILVVILIGVILWFLPFTNSWMRELLFENPLFNWIGKLFS